MARPCTFFIEENPTDAYWRPLGFDRNKWLRELLFGSKNPHSGTLAARLIEGSHRISLALFDFDEDTASTVSTLNEVGIPVIAWLVLPEDRGYWSNPSNTQDTAKRIYQFLSWKERNDLSFYSLGVDWEPPIQVHMTHNGKKVYPRARADYFKKRNVATIPSLQAVLTYVQAHGLQTELYVMPALLSPFFGLQVQPKVDRRVIMAYSTVIGSFGSSKFAMWLMCLGYPNASVAYGIASEVVGSSPGRDFGDGVLPTHLTASELARCIKATPASNKKLPSYLFALNSRNVVHLWENAVKYR